MHVDASRSIGHTVAARHAASLLTHPLSQQPLAGRWGASAAQQPSTPPPVSTSAARPPSPAATPLGWEQEPSWVREQALLAAQRAAAEEQQAHGERWAFLRGGHRSSSSPEPRPAAAAATGSRARQQQQSTLVQRAPAFGEGALSKWH